MSGPSFSSIRKLGKMLQEDMEPSDMGFEGPYEAQDMEGLPGLQKVVDKNGKIVVIANKKTIGAIINE